MAGIPTYTALDALNAAANFGNTVMSDIDQRNRKLAQLDLNSMKTQFTSDVNNEFMRIQQSGDWENWPEQMDKFMNKVAGSMSDKNSPYYCRNPYTAQAAQQMFDAERVEVQQKVKQMQLKRENEHYIEQFNKDCESDRINNLISPQQKVDNARNRASALYDGGVITESEYNRVMDKIYSQTYTDSVVSQVESLFTDGITDKLNFEQLWDKYESQKQQLSKKDLKGLEEVVDTKDLDEQLKKNLAYKYEARIRTMQQQNEGKLVDQFSRVKAAKTDEEVVQAKLEGQQMLAQYEANWDISATAEAQAAIWFYIEPPKITAKPQLKEGEGELANKLADMEYQWDMADKDGKEAMKDELNKLLAQVDPGDNISIKDARYYSKKFGAKEAAPEREKYNIILKDIGDYKTGTNDNGLDNAIAELNAVTIGQDITPEDYEKAVKEVESILTKNKANGDNVDAINDILTSFSEARGESAQRNKNSKIRSAQEKVQKYLKEEKITPATAERLLKLGEAKEVKQTGSGTGGTGGSTSGTRGTGSSTRSDTTSASIDSDTSNSIITALGIETIKTNAQKAIFNDVDEGRYTLEEGRELAWIALKNLADENKIKEIKTTYNVTDEQIDEALGFFAYSWYDNELVNNYTDYKLKDKGYMATATKVKQLEKLQENKDLPLANTGGYVWDQLVDILYTADNGNLKDKELEKIVDGYINAEVATKINTMMENYSYVKDEGSIDPVTKENPEYVDWKNNKQKTDFFVNGMKTLKENDVVYSDKRGRLQWKSEEDRKAAESFGKELRLEVARLNPSLEYNKLEIRYEKDKYGDEIPLPYIFDNSTNQEYHIREAEDENGKDSYKIVKSFNGKDNRTLQPYDYEAGKQLAVNQTKREKETAVRNAQKEKDKAVKTEYHIQTQQTEAIRDKVSNAENPSELIKKYAGAESKTWRIEMNVGKQQILETAAKKLNKEAEELSLEIQDLNKLLKGKKDNELSKDEEKKLRKLMAREKEFEKDTGKTSKEWIKLSMEDRYDIILGN